MTLNMVEVASQTISATEVDYGDSFTFEAEIDIPGILALNKSDLTVELFALDPDQGVSGFHICQAHVEFKGDNIQAIQTDPVYIDQAKPGYPTYVSRTR